ncbi:hypothetical protein SLS60_010852 [Paraconiothyrium brasiliense]|uniref:Uncharacterized protein n=1 Tax=Paraconiothyrium brasiliense TaxID=300254 RepID=A0ABR3QM69_9PLEO
MAVVKAERDIDSSSDTSSETESENEDQSVPRVKRRRVAEDELPSRPRNGYGQRPWHGPTRAHPRNRTRYHNKKPWPNSFNLTIGVARDMVYRQGLDIWALSHPQRVVIKKLLDADEWHKKQAEQQATQSAEATAASSTPPPRQRAEDVFPGQIPVGKKTLQWDRNEKAEGMAGHYNKLQFQRPLYDEGFEVADLQDKTNLELAKMWHEYRDEHYPLQGIDQQGDDAEDDDEASNVLDEPGDSPKGDEATTGAPISMAAMYSPQESGALDGHINTDVVSESSTRDLKNPSSTIRTTASDPVPTQTTNNSTLPNHPAAAPVDGKSALQSVPQTSTRGNGKGQHAQETTRRVALAARVDRYPLQLQGNNNGMAFSMDLDLAAFTIKSKYNRNMTQQLLKDYGGPTGAQVSQLPPSQTSNNGTTTTVASPDTNNRPSSATKKRDREEEDQADAGVEASPQKRPRKMAKTIEAAQATSQEQHVSSGYVATAYGLPFQSSLGQTGLEYQQPSESSAYASSFQDVAQHVPDQHELYQQAWGPIQDPYTEPIYGQPQYEVQPSWSYLEQPVYDQQPAYQGYTIYDNGYQPYQAPPSLPPQAPVSAYTMPPAPGASDMIHPPDTDIPFDPTLLE